MPSSCAVFGEILFDDFGDVKKLGGAPFNVAYNLYRFGLDVAFYSAIGKDENAKVILDFFQKTGFPFECVKQLDFPTGTVKVEHKNGEPYYDIVEGVAYDHIDTDGFEGAQDVLIYCGSLAMRNEYNQSSFFRMLGEGDLFLDINLRPPHYDKKTLQKLLQAATYLKLNEHELKVLQELFVLYGENEAELLEDLAKRFALKRIYVTFGEKGAGYYGDGVFKTYAACEAVGFEDSVGAGDAFSSVLIRGILKNSGVEESIQDALKFAAKVCSLKGALTGEKSFYQLVKTGV